MIEPTVEAFRLKAATRRIWSGDIPTPDADGSFRAVSDVGWIAVVYAKDGGHGAFVETIERAPVERRIRIVHGGRNGDFSLVASVFIESAVGRFEWEAEPGSGHEMLERGQRAPVSTVFRPGTLVLPDGSTHRTSRDTDIFDVPGLVHAYQAWRDADLHGGWKVVTEVPRSAPDEWRPILAAFPLLLFPYPPHA